MSCSVCGEVNCSSGGVLLFERSGLVSAICVECWETFSTAAPASRRIKNEAQLAAAKEKIGVEAQLYHRFLPKTKSFSENISDAIDKYHYKIQPNPICNINLNLTQCNMV